MPATSAPRQAGGMNPMMMRPQTPKGDISPLWRMLGVDFPADHFRVVDACARIAHADNGVVAGRVRREIEPCARRHIQRDVAAHQ